jgi:hypothetical protein
MQDEFRPRLVEVLAGRIQVPADAVVAAGQTASFCTIVGGQLFAWGKLKPSGEQAGRREQGSRRFRILVRVSAVCSRSICPAECPASPLCNCCVPLPFLIRPHFCAARPGDNLMYPIPYEGLSGWTIKSLTCGSSTFACAAQYGNEKSTITWGHSNGYR